MTIVPSRRRGQFAAVAIVIVVGAIVAVSVAISSPPGNGQPSRAGELIIRVSGLPLIGGDLATDTLTDRLVYSGLYRFGDRFRPEPDLADGPCVPGIDMLSLTCHLRAATFHDGSPVTAEDVAFSYRIALSGTCRSALFCFGDGSGVERVEASDERTVAFALREPDPAFESLLAVVSIEPRALIEAAFQEFHRKAAAADRRAVVQLANEMNVELGRDAPQCERDLREAEGLLGATGAIVPERAEFAVGDAFNACAFGAALQYQLESLVATMDATGTDAIAAAYPLLGLYRHPIGSGPWKFETRTAGKDVLLTASDSYHFGRPKINAVRLAAMDDNAALGSIETGSIDWWQGARGEFGRQLRALENVRIVTYPIFTTVALQYNLREERLFSDINLRRAMELCIDRSSTVDTVTNGVAEVATSAIPPASWAHKPEPIPNRDVAEAKRLIEESGWQLGEDGAYTKAGRQLAARVVVGEPGPNGPFTIVNLLDLLIAQARDCGIELTPYPVPPEGRNDMLYNFPHTVPGQLGPFDVVLAAMDSRTDPDDRMWESSEISSPDQPTGLNYMGFANPRVDTVLKAARRTTNIDERARLYAEFQDIVFDQHAMLFLYNPRETTGLSPRVVTQGRDLDTEVWWWPLETLQLASR